jgi:hypothetical protein
VQQSAEEICRRQEQKLIRENIINENSLVMKMAGDSMRNYRWPHVATVSTLETH